LLRPVAVVERPGAGGADRYRAGQAHHDRVVGRREIALFHIVADAGFVDATVEIDAEAIDHIARPAAAFALRLQPLLRSQHAAVAHRLDMKLKVALFAEQAEAVLHLPADLDRGVGRRLCDWRVSGRLRSGARDPCEQSREQHTGKDRTERTTDHGRRV
jgi:hypothetical protein